VAIEKKVYRYQADDIIFHQGDAGGFIYEIQQGRVAIIRTLPNQGPVILGMLGRGHVFGEMALIDNAPRMASARAEENTVCTKIWPDEVQARLAKVPAKSRAVWQDMTNYVRNTLPFEHRPAEQQVAGETEADKKIRGILALVAQPAFQQALTKVDPLIGTLYRSFAEYSMRLLPPTKKP
jgi:CRP-like cAMP-binding protein